jgi:hypothetical protein
MTDQPTEPTTAEGREVAELVTTLSDGGASRR